MRGYSARGRRRARQPMFAIHLWNVYWACIRRLHRTNNYVEAWHSKFARSLHSYHTNIWRFLQALRQEQRDNNQQFVQISGGHRRIRHPADPTYLNQQVFIERIVDNYEQYKQNGQIFVYLRAIAYRLKRPALEMAE